MMISYMYIRCVVMQAGGRDGAIPHASTALQCSIATQMRRPCTSSAPCNCPLQLPTPAAKRACRPPGVLRMPQGVMVNTIYIAAAQNAEVAIRRVLGSQDP